MHSRNFFIELKPPINPNNIDKFYDKIKGLVTTTDRVSLASKPFGQSIAGFDLSYNLASYLLERHPQLDILFHVTCHDLNRVNIRTRLTLLKQLRIKRLLVVSGDGYRQAEEPKLRAIQFEDSRKLAAWILNHFSWFESIGVAGYPGGNGRETFSDEDEVERLSAVMDAGANEVYTQCIFDTHTFASFSRLIKLNFPRVRVIPSVALFKNSSDLAKIALLTRVCESSIRELRGRLDETSSEETTSEFSLKYLSETCARLLNESEKIDLCTFGQFAVAQNLLDRIDCQL